jgi:hypothetical protein
VNGQKRWTAGNVHADHGQVYGTLAKSRSSFKIEELQCCLYKLNELILCFFFILPLSISYTQKFLECSPLVQ